jgi:site-specific recombinase XerC
LVLIPLTIVPGFLVSLIVQDFADRLLAEGTDPSTLRNTVMPLRVIAKWHEARGDIAVNPTRSVQLPSVRGTRDRIASPDEAARLIAALKPADRALWGAAFYAGLRRRELQARRKRKGPHLAGPFGHPVSGGQARDRRTGPSSRPSRCSRKP